MLKITSNGKQSRDLLIVINTKSLQCEDDILHWVLSRLPRHHPSVYNYASRSLAPYCGRKYNYNVVCGTSSIKQDDTVEHNVYIAIHLERYGNYEGSTLECLARSSGGILVDDSSFESNIRPPLPANVVMRCLSINCCGKPWLARMLQSRWPLADETISLIVYYIEPELVRDKVLSIGVSAVTSSYMAHTWRDITHSRGGRLPATNIMHNNDNDGAEYEDSCMFSLGVYRDEPDMDYEDPLFKLDWRDDVACHMHPATSKEESIRMFPVELESCRMYQWHPKSARTRHEFDWSPVCFTGEAWDEFNFRMKSMEEELSTV
jgi:hypothetical protein